MKIAGIREMRARSADLLGGDEPIIVTKHGKVSGIYLPLEEADRLPEDLGRKLASVLGNHLSKLLAAQGITNTDLVRDFSEYRKRRR